MAYSIQPHNIYNAAVLNFGASGGNRKRRLRLRAYDYVEFWIRTSAKSGTTPTLDVAVQQRMPGVAIGEATAIAGKAITQVVSGTSLPNTQIIQLAKADIQSDDMFLVFTITGTATPTWTVSVWMLARGA